MEKWRWIMGYEGMYAVSDQGRVKSWNNNGYGVREVGKELRPSKNSNGYYLFSLRLNGKTRRHKLARLVAQAFIPNPDNKPQVNHKDGVKAHNCYKNLEWNTRKENMRHSVLVLKQHSNKGEKNRFAKISNRDAKGIRVLYNTGEYTQEQLGKSFGLCQSAVSLIVLNKNWGSI